MSTPVEDLVEYENFAAACGGNSFTQSPQWHLVKKDWDSERLILRNAAGELEATAEILMRKIPVINSCFMYVPRGPVCDLHNEAVVRRFAEEIQKLAKKYHAFLIKVDPLIEQDDQVAIDNLCKAGFIHADKNEDTVIQSLSNYVLEFKGRTAEELFNDFESRWRYKIRVAQRKGVVCRYEDNDVHAFRALMEETGKRDGFQIRSAEYFNSMLEAFGENGRLYMCYAPDGTPLSGAIVIRYAGRVSYVYGASGNEQRNLMPNYLMQWEMIRWAAESGCSIYDFMGVPHYHDENHPNYGVYRFKKGFNGRTATYAGEFDIIRNKAVFNLLRHFKKF